MDEIIDVLTYLHVTRPKKVTRNRELWVHELNSARKREGDFHILLPHLEKDPKKFFNYFRMSSNSFYELLAAIQPFITKQNTNMRMCVSPKEKLAVTLR